MPTLSFPSMTLSLAVRQVLLAINRNPAFSILVRALLYICRLLQRRRRRRGSSRSILPASTQAIHLERQCVSDYRPHRNVICASTVPLEQDQIPIPSELTPITPTFQPRRSHSRDVAIPGDVGCETRESFSSPVFNDPANPGSLRPSLTVPERAHLHTSRIENAIPVVGSSEAFPRVEDQKRLGKLEPIQPVAIQDKRYDDRPAISDEHHDFVVDEFCTNFVLNNAPEGWIPIVHPEGALYFVHQHGKILTDAYLCDPENLEHINSFVDDAISLAAKAHLNRLEIVLHLMPDEENIMNCGYYFVDHESRLLLWGQKFDISGSIWEARGTTSPRHIQFKIETDYWAHWDLFPNVCHPTRAVINDIQEILLYYIADSETSSTSTAPYSSIQLRTMLDLAHKLKVSESQPHNLKLSSGYSACVLGRFMYNFSQQKYLNFHGEPCARLERNHSIHTREPPRRTWLIKMLSFALFFAPDVHLQALEQIWVDQTINHVPWNEFIVKLNDDWERYVLFGTVILTANVGFLAIGNLSPTGYFFQIASFVSTFATLGSIIIGLMLLRQNKTKDRHSATAASDYLESMEHPTLGLESLAIMYSLPFALIMWGTVSFTIAFVMLCVWKSNMATYCGVGVPFFIVLALVIWCMWMSWEREERDWWQSTREYWKGKVEVVRKRAKLPKIRPKIVGRLSWDSGRTRPDSEIMEMLPR